MTKKHSCFTLLFFLFTAVLFAAEASIQIADAPYYVGKTIILEVNVIDGQVQDVPLFPPSSQYAIRFRNQKQSRSFSTINGQNTHRFITTFSYAIDFLDDGLIVLPSLLIKTDVGDVTASGLTVNVNPAEKLDGFELLLESSKTDVFQNEETKITVSFLASSSTQNILFSLPFLNNPDLNITPLSASASSGKFYTVELNNKRFIATLKDMSYRGKLYNALSFSFLLSSNVVGPLVLDQGYISFNSAFQLHSIPLSLPLTLNVKPLPDVITSGKGFFAKKEPLITVSLNPDKVYVGDPIRLELSLQNAELFTGDSLALLLAQNRDFELDFVVEALDSEVKDDVQYFRYQLRAKTPNIDVFPSLKFEWFNIEKEQLEIETTPELALTVEAGQRITSDQVIELDQHIAPSQGFLSHLYANDTITNEAQRDQKYKTIFSYYVYFIALLNIVAILFKLLHSSSRTKRWFYKKIYRLGFNYYAKKQDMDSVEKYFSLWLSCLLIGKEGGSINYNSLTYFERVAKLKKKYQFSQADVQTLENLASFYDNRLYNPQKNTALVDNLILPPITYLKE